MKRAKPQAAKLEAELLRLNALVRQRRQQLARLEECPHHDCECRHVWHQVVENELASQVCKVRKHVRQGMGKSAGKVKATVTPARRVK